MLEHAVCAVAGEGLNVVTVCTLWGRCAALGKQGRRVGCSFGVHTSSASRWSDLHPRSSRPITRRVFILGCEHYVKVRGDRDCWVALAAMQELGLQLDNSIARAPAAQQQQRVLQLLDGER